MKKIKSLYIVMGVSLVAFFMRFFLMSQNLFFGPEQGIDFLVIRDIVIHHKLTLIGAKTDISGVFHGPLYYYVAAIPFLLSHGDPLVVAGFLIFLHALAVTGVYLLGKTLFSSRVGILASVLLAVSFEAIAASRWMSGQPLGILIICLFVLFFYKYLKGDDKNLLWVGICFGLLSQVEFLNLLFFSFFIFVTLVIYWRRVFKTNPMLLFFSFFFAVVSSVGTFILFDLRHQFLIFHSIAGLMTGHSGYHLSYISSLVGIFQTFQEVFGLTFIPLWISFGGLISLVLLVFLCIQIVRTKAASYVLLFILFITTPVVLLLLHQDILEHFLLPFIPIFILSASVLINLLWEKAWMLGLGVFLIIVVVNSFAWIQYLPTNEHIFFQSTQPDLRYTDELQTIDSIYTDAKGHPFSYQSYTIPYWSQQGWEYLFWSYGESKYGYEPIAQHAQTLYVIVQRENTVYQQNWLKNTVTTWGTQQKKYTHGSLTTLVLSIKN